MKFTLRWVDYFELYQFLTYISKFWNLAFTARPSALRGFVGFELNEGCEELKKSIEDFLVSY